MTTERKIRKNLDQFLTQAYKKCISIKSEYSKNSKTVFKVVFTEVKAKMEEQCNYFKKYSSHIMVAGSVYDGIKITQMDEYDMDIVIRLPISYEDSDEGILIESALPGYVKLKIGKGFDNLIGQNDWEKCHKVTRFWRDKENYFLQNKFRDWLHSIVARAVKKMKGQVQVNGVTYSLKYTASGPAYTLHIENLKGEDTFKLDVDLVPVIKFQLPRWPNGYRQINNWGLAKDWFVVPKPNKDIEDETLRNRCWRLSFQVFEKEMMIGCQNLKMTIRLVKKMRDSLQMKCLASYYIKTLFLWKIDKVKDRNYWNDRNSKLFREMVGELRDAIAKKNIPYFWNEELNLISGIDSTTLEEYETNLTELIHRIDNDHVVSVIRRVLGHNEMLKLYRRNDGTCSNVSENNSDSTNNQQEPELKGLNKPINYKFMFGNVGDLADRLKELEMENNSFASTSKIGVYDPNPSTSQDVTSNIKTVDFFPSSENFDGDERPKRIKYSSYE